MIGTPKVSVPDAAPPLKPQDDLDLQIQEANRKGDEEATEFDASGNPTGVVKHFAPR